jgi:hypothetical protein
MLHGFGGHLISETFLETVLPEASDEPAAIGRRELACWRKQNSSLGPASSLRAMLDAGIRPFAAALGLDLGSGISYRSTNVAATLVGGPDPIAVLVTSWGEALDPLWRSAVTAALERAAACCLLFNGTHVRLVDTSRSFSRRYVEFDLDAILDDERSFRAFWTVLRGFPLHELIAGSDRHGANVCRSLKSGVLEASTDILSALVGRRPRRALALDHAFEQALTIVYRVLFLLFAEARALVPLWHPVYRESYSLQGLRDAIEHSDGALGLWDTLRAIGRLAHAGCRAGDLHVAPFNGRLFAPARTPLAERRDLDDEAARRALVALSTRPAADRRGRERIAYRDLGVEQLGAVYETLLDYRPEVGEGSPAGRPSVTLRTGSGLRKATGTFYTPQPIAEFLVRRTLGPLVHDAEPDRILQLRVVDPAMGSGAFLVAACRYLAAAYEAALVRSGACYAADVGEPERAAIRRTIAERCLYGVDVNPMAVQLARLSLWLATLAGGRPLSFLDHRLHTGNSLVGAWLTALARPPLPRQRSRVDVGAPLLFGDALVRDALQEMMPVRFWLEQLPDDTVAQVREKEKAFAALNGRGSSLGKWRRIADLWCASWLDTASVPPAAYRPLMDAVLTGARELPPASSRGYLDHAEAIARTTRFFHWELEFPEVFFDAEGARLPNPGFDAVIGNPPWDMIRAGGSSSPDDARRLLRFSRDAGVYGAQSDGHANCYQLFVERALTLTRTGGRTGLVLPAGLATDSGNASLRRLLLTRSDIDTLVGLDNQRGIFPIHRSIRFVLLTGTGGRPTQTIACKVGVNDPADLDAVSDDPAASVPWFDVRLTVPVLQHLSGESLAIPWLRRPVDLAIAERASALFRPLGSEEGWHARFGRELNATEDRDVFRRAGEGLPVIEGKQLDPFVVRLNESRWSIRERDVRARLRDGRYRKRRLAYRDVASASNQLTLIAAVLPAGSVSTHTVFCLRTPIARSDELFLCGLFNSWVLNYLVRLRVSTHVTTAVVEQLPVPTRAHAPGRARRIAALARVLLSRRLDSAAHAALQASVAALYQLTAAEFDHVLSTFPLVPSAAREAAAAAYRCGLTPTTRPRRHER